MVLSKQPSPHDDGNWMSIRQRRTTAAQEDATSTGLTGFEVVQRQGKEVVLRDGSRYTEFISCSYLGLEHHSDLIAATHQALDRIGIHLSASRSAMSPTSLTDLERLLAISYQGCSVTVFTSTSNAHLGVLPLLGSGKMLGYPIKRSVRWLIDRTAHASMQVLRGLYSQFGEVERVDALDLDHLRHALEQALLAQATPILLIDGVGSMSGLMPVQALSETLAQYEGYLYVGDAHGISIRGKHGAGYAFENLGHQLPDNTLIAGSLSKAFGGAGGFIVLRPGYTASQLRTLANPLVFGHTVPVPLQAANVAAAEIHLSSEIEVLQKALWQNVRTVDTLCSMPLMNGHLHAPIRGAFFNDEPTGLAAAHALRTAGMIAFPVFYPIVTT